MISVGPFCVMFDAMSTRPPFTILVSGPESSGKTTLAVQLAAALDGLYVAEAARAYLIRQSGLYSEADLPLIWAAQAKAEDTARASSASFVVCDTGPEVIYHWALVRFGRVPTEVIRASRKRHYDLVLLCTPDLPWEPDPLREAPDLDRRQAYFKAYRELVPGATIISGSNRPAQALAAVFSR